ncbi:MAG: plasmid mobilization relaxosome protein MobC [Ruminococcus sp.]|nr:plasmid mobilization relaxosome protein MobC [Ruminococcus sp.]
MMNLSISEYFTFVLNKKRIVICEDSRELVNQIMRIGNNINQIAAVANKNRYISNHSISEVKGMVEECRDSLIEFISFIYESEPDYTQNDSVKNAIILEEIVTTLRMCLSSKKCIEGAPKNT